MPGPKQAWATFVYVLTKCMLLTTNYSWNGLFLLLQQRRKSPNLHLIQISFTTLTTIVNSYINDTSPCINLSWVHRKRLWWVLLGRAWAGYLEGDNISTKIESGRVEIEIGEASPTFWKIEIGEASPTFKISEAIRGKSRPISTLPDF